MTRKERVRIALTIVAAVAAGGAAGAGVGAHVFSPLVAVSLAVLIDSSALCWDLMEPSSSRPSDGPRCTTPPDLVRSR